jgi:hypothetical protein
LYIEETDAAVSGGIRGNYSLIYFLSNNRIGLKAQNDFMEVCYFVGVDDFGRGALIRRYADRGIKALINGDMDSDSKIHNFMNKLRTDPDPDERYRSCEVLVNNVYEFNVFCYDKNGNPITGIYYSKDTANSNLIPASVEIELLTLDAEQWQRTNWMAQADFKNYAMTNAAKNATTLSFMLGETF